MVDWPQTPSATHVSAPDWIDPILEFRVDQGYSIRRSRYTRGFRRYHLEYIGKTNSERIVIFDFIRRVLRGNAGTFTWVHPRLNTAITAITNATPINVNLASPHGLITGDWVYLAGVTGNTAANGGWRITRFDDDQFFLDGSVGNGTWPGGTGSVQHYFPTMRLVLPEDTYSSQERLIGSDRDNDGRWNFRVTMEEIP